MGVDQSYKESESSYEYKSNETGKDPNTNLYSQPISICETSKQAHEKIV